MEVLPILHVRPMTGDDLDSVMAIETASYSTPWKQEHFRNEIASRFSWPYVAVEEGYVVGYVCLMSLFEEAQILNIAVAPGKRGRGIARLLLGQAFSRALDQGAEVMALEVRASNSAAISLYEKLGFARVGIRARYYDAVEDAVLMEKTLKENQLMQFTSLILSNVEVSPGYWRMRMTAPPEFGSARPGQFVMVRVNGAIDPLLRRPFGIFDVGTYTPAQSGGQSQPYLEMLYRVVGKGTAMLSTLHGSDLLDVLGPLGKGFDLGAPEEEKLIVGGGVGLAPLYLLARELVKGSKVRLFAGGRTRDDILCITEFERLGVECYTATEDGSLGECGLVTEALLRRLDQLQGRATIFACGPHGMLNAVARIAAERSIPCQVSLEGYMACGVGACLGCVAPGHSHSPETPDFRCVCTEGPVFESGELKWEE